MLKERGLKVVREIIAHACMGLSESAVEFFPEATWQRVNRPRNVPTLGRAIFPVGGVGYQPFERSGPPFFGGRPRRLTGGADD